MTEEYEFRSAETHIEVHKFFPGSIVLVTAIALVLQSTARVYFPKLEMLDLPLLVTQEPLEFQKEAEAQSAPGPSTPAETPATATPAAVKP